MTPSKLALFSIIFAIFPFLVALLAMGIANLCGCTLNEAEASKCVIFGRDFSGLLYGMLIFGWLGMFTGGIGAIGLVASAIWAVIK